ncbi:MAG: cell division protein FtsQ [Cyclobacteriaceae bacterium]|nr:MAG: cell division protein FtsQ [Cyclobacteriaceae bacterium]
MIKRTFNLRREATIGILIAGILALIAFTGRDYTNDVVNNVQVTINNDEENHVLEEEDIFNLMQLDRENLLGASVKSLNLRNLEQRIRTNRWVNDADVYVDLKGNLFIEVHLRRALARMLRPDGSGAFIATDGTVMPVPERFAVRRLVISGTRTSALMQAENLYSDEYGAALMILLHQLNEDEFWRAQIAQLDISKAGKIIMIPQVGGQIIEFGYPENAEEKLKKLGIFFTRILPTRGWNRYHRVNVEYQNQIVAE